ncbi:TPA: hypothetical protein SJ157_000278 [Yersinia enterocolitica]|nr:hypothetical protein [Yersinia enterocolitica]HEI6714423.1 hypothetical protein [Yersinia enterocolitica]
MMNVFLAAALALALVAYWYLCRNRALKLQKKAADLMEKYFKSADVLEKEKESIYLSYRLTRHWWFLPFAAFMTPIIMFYAIITQRNVLDVTTSKEKVRKQREHDEIFDLLMRMYISKNPLTSFICITYIGISFAVALPIGFMLNRLTSLPEISSIFNTLTLVTMKAMKKAHAH